MAGKFYAVKIGKVPGIYSTWDACKAMVDGFSGTVYRRFKTRA
jgi:ribonuclease HI